MLEPRDPLLKVFTICVLLGHHYQQSFKGPLAGARQPEGRREANPMARQSNKGRYAMGEELEAETPGSAKPLSLGNDPSAGSPTETLLRLLLPLNDQV